MTFLLTTLVFALVGLVGSVGVRFVFNKGPSANLLHVMLVIVSAVCCWLLWAIVYMAQMNPLVNPILDEAEWHYEKHFEGMLFFLFELNTKLRIGFNITIKASG